MRILSLDGGGYLGLATAAFLAELERHFGVTCHDQFDMFCGTSTGAIIALGLAAGKTANEIATLYEQFGPRVFWNPVPGIRFTRTYIRGLFVARYSNRALVAALNDAFGDLTLGELRSNNKFALVAAFCVTNGRPRVFKTNHAPDLTLDDHYFVRDIALASAAAPIYLPLVHLTAPGSNVCEQFCDGGVFANHPALLGYSEAVSHLGLDPTAVQIVSVSTPRGDHAERDSHRNLVQMSLHSRGLLAWGANLPGIMIDSTAQIAHETLRRLTDWPPRTHTRYVRIDLDKPAGLELDIATHRATRTLQQVGTDRARLSDTRTTLAPFFRRQEVLHG